MAVSSDQPARRREAPRATVGLSLALLLALVAVQTARYWRYFPMLIGDQGWFLQVAARLSQGETLYSDVIWAYGPLSAQALAWLFRVAGPDAGLATLINGLLAAASLLFIYAAVRSLLRPLDALLVVAFAAVTGGHMAGDLIRQHLLVYNQSVSWGMAASLGALAAALRWHHTQRWPWLALAGAATGLASLAKLEFGATAVAVVAVLLLSSRAPVRAWLGWLAAAGLVALLGFAWQAGASGWQALWRGYSGYDMVAQGAFGALNWDRSAGWPAWRPSGWPWPCSGWAGAGPQRWRWLLYAGAVASLGLGIMAVASAVTLRFAPQAALSEISWRWWVSGVLQWLVAAPWALLTPLLLGAAWLGRRYHAPPAWWTLWSFALLANLRLLLLGFSSGVAIAPALAVFAWLATAQHSRNAAARCNQPGTLAAGCAGDLAGPDRRQPAGASADARRARAEIGRGFPPAWATSPSATRPARRKSLPFRPASPARRCPTMRSLPTAGARRGICSPGAPTGHPSTWRWEACSARAALRLAPGNPALAATAGRCDPARGVLAARLRSRANAQPSLCLARQPARVVGQPAPGLCGGAFIRLGQVGGVMASVRRVRPDWQARRRHLPGQVAPMAAFCAWRKPC